MIDCKYVLWGCTTDQVSQVRTVVAHAQSLSLLIRSKNASSASLNNSVINDMSVSAKPNLLTRFRNESSRARSAIEQVPDQAGAQYVTFANDCSTEHILQRGWWDAVTSQNVQSVQKTGAWWQQMIHIISRCQTIVDNYPEHSVVAHTFNVHTWWRR